MASHSSTSHTANLITIHNQFQAHLFLIQFLSLRLEVLLNPNSHFSLLSLSIKCHPKASSPNPLPFIYKSKTLSKQTNLKHLSSKAYQTFTHSSITINNKIKTSTHNLTKISLNILNIAHTVVKASEHINPNTNSSQIFQTQRICARQSQQDSLKLNKKSKEKKRSINVN